ncbi:hypothetical protein INR49_015561 [Caranx melampygus]|nr:hypothetical protein INR49_015561 [Caranx melampygus]
MCASLRSPLRAARIHNFLPSHLHQNTHLRTGTVRCTPGPLVSTVSPDSTGMTDAVKDQQRSPSESQRTEMIHVAVKSLTESKDFTVRGDCTVRQVEFLPLRPQRSSAASTSDPASDTVQSDLTDVLDSDHDMLTPSPTSPLCLVEGLESLGLTNNGPGFFPALQRQMEKQLLSDPEMMRFQQLLETNPEVEDMLNNTDIITQVLELIRNPDLIEEVMHNEDRALGNLEPEQNVHETITNDSDAPQKTEAKVQEHLKLSQQGAPVVVKSSSGNRRTPRRERDQTPPFSSMQSLLEEITASPGLIESLLSGPYVSSLLNCLSQNPDLAAQMLLSHPLFSGNPQLQQQMRQQLPLFLQQMQSPELLSAMLNPRAMEAVLQIQQGLQTLATEAPALIPAAGLGNTGASVNIAPELASDSVLNSQSGNGPQVATVTEQQQQFVQQMLQALANTNNGAHPQEAEFKEELEHLNSMGFRDVQANLRALIRTGGDLNTAIQQLLGL